MEPVEIVWNRFRNQLESLKSVVIEGSRMKSLSTSIEISGNLRLERRLRLNASILRLT